MFYARSHSGLCYFGTLYGAVRAEPLEILLIWIAEDYDAYLYMKFVHPQLANATHSKTVTVFTKYPFNEKLIFLNMGGRVLHNLEN